MPRTKETITVGDRLKATGKASKPNKESKPNNGAPQPKQKPPPKPKKWPQKYSELTVYDVKQTEVQAACVEIQIVNSPAEPPTYGEQILLHVMVPYKINGVEPNEYLTAFSCSHSDEERRAYVKEWRVNHKYDFPTIQFRMGGGHNELQLSVYINMRKRYNQWVTTFNRQKESLRLGSIKPKEAIPFDRWSVYYCDGIRFIAHYHLLFPDKSPNIVVNDCLKIFKNEIKTKSDLKHYFTRLTKELHFGYALDEMDSLKNINEDTENKMVILRRVLWHLKKPETGTNRVIFQRLQKWVTDIPATEKALLKEVSWLLELQLDEQPDEREKRLELEAKEAQKEEKKCKREEKKAIEEANKKKREEKKALAQAAKKKKDPSPENKKPEA